MFGKKKLPGTLQKTPSYFLELTQEKKPVPITPSKPIQRSEKKPPRYTEPTKEELHVLNIAAKKSALAGDEVLTEEYRARGVSLDTIARAVGISGNKNYAEFLLQQNPQALELANELAVGFMLIGERAYVQELLSRGAKAPTVLARYKNLLPTLNHSPPKQRQYLSKKKVQTQSIPLPPIIKQSTEPPPTQNKLTPKPPVTTNTAHRRSLFPDKIAPPTKPRSSFFKINDDRPLSIDSGGESSSEESFTLEDTL